jgi:hypothetical protein
LRVGYAGYFIPGKWEDHWVCEYHTGSRWVLFDAELGPSARKHYKIGFPSADIPEGEWRSAGSVWHSIRAGTVEPTVCGVNAISIHGRWFVASAVLRDAAALAGIECLPWDYWGPGRDFRRTRQVIEEEAKQIDALAEALYPAPANRDEAEALLGRFPWARPRETVESIVLDRPVEVPILPMS